MCDAFEYRDETVECQDDTTSTSLYYYHPAFGSESKTLRTESTCHHLCLLWYNLTILSKIKEGDKLMIHPIHEAPCTQNDSITTTTNITDSSESNVNVDKQSRSENIPTLHDIRVQERDQDTQYYMRAETISEKLIHDRQSLFYRLKVDDRWFQYFQRKEQGSSRTALRYVLHGFLTYLLSPYYIACKEDVVTLLTTDIDPSQTQCKCLACYEGETIPFREANTTHDMIYLFETTLENLTTCLRSTYDDYHELRNLLAESWRRWLDLPSVSNPDPYQESVEPFFSFPGHSLGNDNHLIESDATSVHNESNDTPSDTVNLSDNRNDLIKEEKEKRVFEDGITLSTHRYNKHVNKNNTTRPRVYSDSGDSGSVHIDNFPTTFAVDSSNTHTTSMYTNHKSIRKNNTIKRHSNSSSSKKQTRKEQENIHVTVHTDNDKRGFEEIEPEEIQNTIRQLKIILMIQAITHRKRITH